MYLDPWDVHVHVCAYTHSLSIHISGCCTKIYKFFRQYGDTDILTLGSGYCEYLNYKMIRQVSAPVCSLQRVYMWMRCGNTDPGVEFCWCSVLFSSQQFSALTEVLFHFLTEPKEVKYLVIRRVLNVGLTALRCLESEGLACSLSAGGKVSGSALWVCHHQSDQPWPSQKHCEKPPSGSKWWVASLSSWGQRRSLNGVSDHGVGQRALGAEPVHSMENQTWAGLSLGGKPGTQITTVEWTRGTAKSAVCIPASIPKLLSGPLHSV